MRSTHQQLTAQLETNPKNVLARLGMIDLLQKVAMQHVQAGRREKGMGLFVESARLARELTTEGSELPAAGATLIGQAYYNEACALSDAGKPEDALQSLDDAFAQGFSDMKLLNSDPDLVRVRNLPDFAQRVAKWETAAKEAARKHVVEELARGTSFPFDFEVTDLAGDTHKLADYKGKVLVVDFWGTWCPPCRAELPSFIKLQETYGPKGFQMIGLNYENDRSEAAADKVRNFNKSQGINYPCALADDSIRAQVPNFQGYPTTLFIDASGKVRMKVVGLHDYQFLESVVTILLEEIPSSP